LTAGVGAAGASTPDELSWGYGNGGPRVQVIEIEVAENGTLFRVDPDLAFEDDGMPARGSTFVAQGYIYPKGTLTGANGANPDGSPEFPDKVIGTWICYGIHVGDGAHTATGPWVVTTQIYDFDDEHGAETIVSDGYELVDIGVPVMRAITGGTGEFANARGEVEEISHGFNASLGISASFTLEVRTR
jgi:hypothetical protein